MTKKILWVVPLMMLFDTALYAQADIVGDWQGKVGNGSRIVLQIANGY